MMLDKKKNIMTKSLNAVGASTYQSIKRDIIFGDLAPASKLKLETLRKNYNASMSTLRETLNRLASEGFVDALDQRGFFVTPVSKEDLMEVAKLSIENGDTDWEGNLVSAHHKLSSMEQKMLSGDDSQKEDWKRYDWEFHLALIEACGSRNLISLHSVLYDKYLRYQMLMLTHRGQEAADEHKQMLEAALDRNVEAATKTLTVHIEKGLEHTLAAF
jgi:DNA-binding GntR family transcriptional regulator